MCQAARWKLCGAPLTFRYSQVGDHCFIHFSRLFTSCFLSLPAARVRLATKQMQVEPESEQEGLD